MVTVKCAKCKGRIFRYLKIGKGELWHCWKDRIKEDYSIREGSQVKCQCGNIIGIEQDKWIKMKQHSFTYSGAAARK